MRTQPFIEDGYEYRVPTEHSGLLTAIAAAGVAGALTIALGFAAVSVLPARIEARASLTNTVPTTVHKRQGHESVYPRHQARGRVERAPVSLNDESQRDASGIAAKPAHATQTSHAGTRARFVSHAPANRTVSKSDRDKETML